MLNKNKEKGDKVRKLTGAEEEAARGIIQGCVELARRFATCQRWRCGSMVVKNGDVIGVGFNSPPKGKESQRRCHISKRTLVNKITDRSCCIHAEHRAIFNALKQLPEKVNGATIYFARIDAEGKFKSAGKPHCTQCSRTALDAGIGYFVLGHEDGIYEYEMEEYNLLSYEFTYE